MIHSGITDSIRLLMSSESIINYKVNDFQTEWLTWFTNA